MGSRSNLPPGAFAQKDPLGGIPNVALPYQIPAFVASSLGSGAVVLSESVSHVASGLDPLASVVSGTGLLRSVDRVSDREDGVANYFEGNHFQITDDMLDWSIRPVLTTPAQDTPIVTESGSGLASGSYYYVVTVRSNLAGESSWVTGMTFASALLGPSVSAGTIKVGWEAIDNAGDYRVYRTHALGGNGTPDFATATSGGLLATVAGATQYTDDGSVLVTAGTDPPAANTAYDEPLALSGYTADYTYSKFRYNTPKKYRSLEDVNRDHGFGSQAAIMAEFAMSNVPGRGNAAPAVWITAAGDSGNPGQAPSLSDYQTALTGFSTILQDNLLVVMGAESNNLRQQLKQYVETESNLENRREKLGIVYMPNGTPIGSSGDSSTILGQAALMGSRRMIMIAIDSGAANGDVQDAATSTHVIQTVAPEYVAAMVAGKQASLTDTAEPLTRKTFVGLITMIGTREYNPNEAKALRDNGTMFLDWISDSNWRVFQGVTTSTANQDDAELSVVTASDTLAFAWRDSIDPVVGGAQASLIGNKLTPGLLATVKTRTIIVLDNLANEGIINGYDKESIFVEQDPSVLTRVNVTFNYEPIFPVNTVILTFNTSFTLSG